MNFLAKLDDDPENLEENSFDESEYILEFIEKFNDLFESGHYTEAVSLFLNFIFLFLDSY